MGGCRTFIPWRIKIDGSIEYPTAFGTYELQEITYINYTR